jgi:membrane protein
VSEPSIPRQFTADEGPERLSELPGRLWWRAFKRIRSRFTDDHLTVWAAALTYYGVLSLFPALLVFVSVLRLTGDRNTETVLRKLTDTTPGPARDILRTALTDLEKGHQSTAGVLAIVGLLVALWSASSYVGAFMQAANAIFDVP